MKQKIVDLINVFFGFRKFILMVLLFLVAIVMRVKGYIDGAQFATLLESTTVSFFATNGVEHITTTVKDFLASKGKKDAPAPIQENP